MRIAILLLAIVMTGCGGSGNSGVEKPANPEAAPKNPIVSS
jgi:hypothetical protein